MFTPKERVAIESAFRPLGNITAESLVNSDNPSSIGNLIEHLKRENQRHLGYRLLKEADKLVSENVPVLSLHFYWQSRGSYFYRWRDCDDFALEEAIKSFQKQIGLSANALREFRENDAWGIVPAHAGYRQLRIIEEKRGNLTLARALCQKAKSEGWADDWDNHITRIEKKLAKITSV